MLEKNTERLQELTEEGGGGPTASGEGAAAGQEDNRIQVLVYIHSLCACACVCHTNKYTYIHMYIGGESDKGDGAVPGRAAEHLRGRGGGLLVGRAALLLPCEPLLPVLHHCRRSYL